MPGKLKKIVLGILGFILLAVIVVNASFDTPAEKAPDFVMIDKDGQSVKLSDILAEGKPIVLNFWASWCPPCRKEMPDFEKVYKELGNEVQFMMVNLTDGQRETVQRGAKYIEDNGHTFPVYFDTKQEGARAYGIRAIPTTLFIDKNGHITTSARGAIDEKMLRQRIELIK